MNEIEPMIDLYWNEKFPDCIYYLAPNGFFCLGGLSVVRRTTTVWPIRELKECGFQRIGEL